MPGRNALRRTLLAALVGAALPGAALAQVGANPQLILAGKHEGIRFTVYNTVSLDWGAVDEGTLRIAALPGSVVLGVKWNSPSITLAIRTGETLEEVAAYHQERLTSQGFSLETRQEGSRQISAVLRRPGSTVGLTVEQSGNNTFRVTFNLTGERVRVVPPSTGQGQ
ncbi:MAG TPA: hypothetical protein VNT60_09655 [Deinococcales bacterium]|nr:hypothetical protein [Deinococcales bacterium]